MKLNKYFLIGAMGLGLFACSDDNDPVDNGQNGNAQDGKTYMAISLDFDKMSARTVTQPGLAGTEAERKINNVYVIVAGEEDGSFTEVAGGDVSNLTNGSKYYPDDNTLTFATSPGRKQVYVVVNAVTPPTKNNKIGDYLSNLEENLDAGDLSKGLLMSGKAVSEINVPLGQTEASAKAQPMEVTVERAVAKFTVTCSEASFAIKAGGTENGTKGELVEVKYNFEGGVQDGYRWNPNHTSLTTKATNRGYTGTGDIIVNTQPADDSVTPVYCLENLEEQTGTDNMYPEDKATYFVVQAKYIPSKVVDIAKDGEVKDNGSSDPVSFYYVTAGKLKGAYLLKSDLDEWQKDTDNTTTYPNGVDAISGEYKDGICWFGPVWIGEGGGNIGSKTDIFRNKWYNYDITNFTLPGKTDKPGPGEPDTFMGVKLTIANWAWKNVDIELQ